MDKGTFPAASWIQITQPRRYSVRPLPAHIQLAKMVWVSWTLNLTAGGTRTFALSMTAAGNANIIEFDDATGGGTRDSGMLLKQTTSAFSLSAITGNYAFGFVGIDASQNRFGMAGSFVADGAGNFTGGVLDSDDSSSGVSSNVSFTGGYAVATNGRGTANIKTAQGTTGYSFYIVNATQLLVIETDTFTTGGFPLLSGTILQQTPGSFQSAISSAPASSK